jgi:dTDP-glucose 4,6-dehydratase
MEFIRGNICDERVVARALESADAVVHAAAESHVDRSFANANVFLRTNVFGTHVVLEACRRYDVGRVIHVSTDEVYGPRSEDDEALEGDTLAPTNPYSASKAAAEMLAVAAFRSFKLPIIVLRPNNIYGSRQDSEKLLPRFIGCAMRGEPLTVHGSGRQRRRYLSASDLVEATLLLLARGEPGEVYNAGVADSYSIHDVVDLVAGYFGNNVRRLVAFVEDRPYNDFCYATCSAKLRALGWQPERNLRADFAGLADEIVRMEQQGFERPAQRLAARAAT